MSTTVPIFASSRTAAKLFDLREPEFLQLVEAGHLPGAIDIGGGIRRWEVDRLRLIASGTAALGGEMDW
ncbi:hypothetical protein [Paracoccus siganidrum]|uniref:DNA-binding protein n=1 Tax=Paracoccus siganidrum TaxID=1276757 RepID=A0A419A4K3_9RHOB|nr:hypothetical protein [Paracoccus siganidrum]RJL09454.1 hypothetical protein D3P05_14950 [Paracoccus siganidrum]RMC39054.1 hypothetical protein C9E82_06575 [Paracoccus siganidrum]